MQPRSAGGGPPAGHSRGLVPRLNRARPVRCAAAGPRGRRLADRVGVGRARKCLPPRPRLAGRHPAARRKRGWTAGFRTIIARWVCLPRRDRVARVRPHEAASSNGASPSRPTGASRERDGGDHRFRLVPGVDHATAEFGERLAQCRRRRGGGVRVLSPVFPGPFGPAHVQRVTRRALLCSSRVHLQRRLASAHRARHR